MSRIQHKIFNDMIQKLGIAANDRLTSKAIETLDLIQVKCNEILKHLNDNAKVVLCIDICCELLNLQFAESSSVLSNSSLKKSVYNKNRKIILKVLNLDKKVTIDDVIRKLGVTHSQGVERNAKNIFNHYQKQQAYEEDISNIHPSITCMCVYYACKFENVKIPKKNILNISTLTHGQWAVFEKSWSKWISECERSTNKDNKKNKLVEDDENISTIRLPTENQKKCEEAEESYDTWAKRILEEAYDYLAKNKKN